MLPQRIKSIWMETTPATNYTSAENGLTADILIIGAGIAGLNAAYFLIEKGLKPIVIEKNRIASGTSGNTTAKITSQHGLIYAYLKKFFGRELGKIYADSNQWAIEEADRIIKKEKIDCDFYRAPALIFADTEEGQKKIKEEIEAAKDLELPATFISSVENLPFTFLGAEKFENQAFFHPRKYLLRLAEIIQERGGKIYEETLALNIEENSDYYNVKTENGNIKAQTVIIASNFPFYDKGFFFARENQIRSYALALKLNNPFPRVEMIGIDGPQLSFRPCLIGTEEWLIAGGEDHVAGEALDVNHYENLEKLIRSKLNIKSIDYMWAAEDSSPLDHIPFIGKMPFQSRLRPAEIFRRAVNPWAGDSHGYKKDGKGIYITTGFNEWGMTTSFVSAKIISDLVSGEENEWEKLYNPSRVNIAASTRKAITLGEKVIKGFARKIPIQKKEGEKLPIPGGAKVISLDNEKIAVYNEYGKIHAVSAVCTHLKCIVNWNNMEKTWDCPCHGSRYTYDGEVISGPAVKPLKRVTVEKLTTEKEEIKNLSE